ncbi:MAG: DUF3793 family protein [bacterium]|nr:DUF3793 family protein [bacterium]
MPIEHFLAYHCGPAMAGIKPANIASCVKTENSDVLLSIKRLDNILQRRGICIEILCECEERYLIMVYRRKKLCEYLNSPQIKALLTEFGYPYKFSLELYLDILKNKIKKVCARGEGFPHEIGAFLGYPAHDIYGFINHKNEGCMLTGEWKVYAEAEKAQKLFYRYSACRRAILKHLHGGKTLEELFCAA